MTQIPLPRTRKNQFPQANASSPSPRRRSLLTACILLIAKPAHAIAALATATTTPAKSFFDFGATGNGRTVDTAAIVKALASGIPIIQDGGTFLIDTQVTVEQPIKLLMSGGARFVLKAGANPPNAFLLQGDNNHIEGLNIIGSCSAEVIKVVGSNPYLKDISIDGQNASRCGLLLVNPEKGTVIAPYIRNCLGPAAISAASGLTATGKVAGLQIIDPKIDNIAAPNSGNIGAPAGSARAITVLTPQSSGEVSISGGRLTRITGREGDAIQIISSSVQDDFTLRVEGTEITDVKRKAIKVQCGLARISRVKAKTVELTQLDIPVGMASIETFGRFVSVENCELDARHFDFAIVSSGASSGTLSNNSILIGDTPANSPIWKGRSSQVGIYVSRSSDIEVTRNEIHGGIAGIRFNETRHCSAKTNTLYGQTDAGVWETSSCSETEAHENRIYDERGKGPKYGILLNGTSSVARRNVTTLSNPAIVSITEYAGDTSRDCLLIENSSNGHSKTVASSSRFNRLEGNKNTGSGESGE